jgi:hypothetical protein
MIRPILTEFALFIAPFAVYALFLLATRGGVVHPDAWSWRVIGWLTIAALIGMIASFFVFAHLAGVPMDRTYVPARVEDGKLVPGEAR